MTPKNKDLINIREDLQKKLMIGILKIKVIKINIEEYKKFFKEIGYLKEEGPDFQIQTSKM